MERIIENLEKVKLKLDEAFFYLDEIEELLVEDPMDAEAGTRVGQASERLASELLALSSKVMELQDILEALDERESAGGGSPGAASEPPTAGG